MSLIQNKKAYFNFEILEKLEAGLKLLGHEVKSVKKGQGSLEGSYVTIRSNKKGAGEAYLVHAFISPYQAGNVPESYDPYRERKLLLNRGEINSLIGKEKTMGLTIVPISLYNKNNRVKVELGIARGKKKHDKRESIKKRDTEREIGRRLKN